MNMYTVLDLVHIVTHGEHDAQGVIISLQGNFIKAGKILSLEIFIVLIFTMPAFQLKNAN